MKFYFTPSTNKQCWAYVLDDTNYYRPLPIGKIDKADSAHYTGRFFESEGKITINTPRAVVTGSTRTRVAEKLWEAWKASNPKSMVGDGWNYIPAEVSQ